MSEFLDALQNAVAEVPENVGRALGFLGDQIAELGELLEKLAARIDALEDKKA